MRVSREDGAAMDLLLIGLGLSLGSGLALSGMGLLKVEFTTDFELHGMFLVMLTSFAPSFALMGDRFKTDEGLESVLLSLATVDGLTEVFLDVSEEAFQLSKRVEGAIDRRMLDGFVGLVKTSIERLAVLVILGLFGTGTLTASSFPRSVVGCLMGEMLSKMGALILPTICLPSGEGRKCSSLEGEALMKVLATAFGDEAFEGSMTCCSSSSAMFWVTTMFSVTVSIWIVFSKGRQIL